MLIYRARAVCASRSNDYNIIYIINIRGRSIEACRHARILRDLIYHYYMLMQPTRRRDVAIWMFNINTYIFNQETRVEATLMPPQHTCIYVRAASDYLWRVRTVLRLTVSTCMRVLYKYMYIYTYIYVAVLNFLAQACT